MTSVKTLQSKLDALQIWKWSKKKITDWIQKKDWKEGKKKIRRNLEKRWSFKLHGYHEYSSRILSFLDKKEKPILFREPSPITWSISKSMSMDMMGGFQILQQLDQTDQGVAH